MDMLDLSMIMPIFSMAHSHSAAIERDEPFQPGGAPLELVGARGLLECVLRAQGIAPGCQGRLGQDAEWPVQLGKDCAGAVEVRGEACVYVLGAAGVEDAALAFEDVEPPCFGARHGVGAGAVVIVVVRDFTRFAPDAREPGGALRA